ncbi:MAG: adenosylmethionine--8-amino-7-oxononanoate transaminase [Rhodospirillaceae bacterium]|nr:adenosylmethionine--8-amino-7-oxononanoate transaminase [Rhodospirillaceae bacterium]MBT6883669.1 adenosylmethionine--8-amino-7-oxononanoate transaminase [Rhodospirillaceae bacterium]
MTTPSDVPPANPDWFTTGHKHIWMPYTQMKSSPLPQAVKSTEGVRIRLEDGRELIDGIASWWSACHGYNHPHIVDAITRQAKTMPHVMLAGLSNEPAFTLAARLAAMTPGDLNRVFFSESGSVSVEIAMKMAVQFWINQGHKNRNRFIAFKNGYHGDTIGTMGVGDPDNIMHGPFHGLMAQQLVVDLPANETDRTAFEALAAEHAGTLAGIIMEPLVQGAGGMIFHATETVKFIRDVCDRHGILLILDEIMVGLGRLGTTFACEQADVTPDLMTLSKSLAGGTMPLAATIATDRIFEAFYADELERCLMHGPTYTGNALACAAANASLDLFETEPRLDQVQAMAAQMIDALAPCRDIAGVMDVRVRGGIGVIELETLGDMYWIRDQFIAKGCWVRPFGNVIYLMPAFNIDPADLTTLTDAVVEITAMWSEKRGEWA